MQAVDDDGGVKTTQQSNKETRGNDNEHSKGEGKSCSRIAGVNTY
jgi:hypothetical protein